MLKQKQTLRDIKNACDDNNTAAPSKLFFELNITSEIMVQQQIISYAIIEHNTRDSIFLGGLFQI